MIFARAGKTISGSPRTFCRAYLALWRTSRCPSLRPARAAVAAGAAEGLEQARAGVLPHSLQDIKRLLTNLKAHVRQACLQKRRGQLCRRAEGLQSLDALQANLFILVLETIGQAKDDHLVPDPQR